VTTQAITIDAALTDRKLLGGAFVDLATWATWRVVLAAAFGGALDRAQRRAFAAVAGGRKPPARRVAELWAIVGRRSGKSRMAAAVAAFIALFFNHSDRLAAGEPGYILVLAPSRSQAALVFGYIEAFLRSNQMLEAQIESVTADEIKLRGNIVIAVHSNSFRTVRGRTLLACVFDETSFWRDETTANPDVETYRAVLPALATTGGMLIGISTPYRKAGLLFQKFHDHFGKNDADVLVVHGASLKFNPTIDRGVIARARRSDPTSAASEWDAQFRDDISGFVAREAIDAAVEAGVRERAPESGCLYVGFFDAAGGSAGGDSMTMAIAHAKDGKLILDAVRERRPPFSPEDTAAEFGALFRHYGVSVAEGDKWGGTWPAEALRRHGIGYRAAERTRSEIYLDLLPELNSGRVHLLDNERLIAQLGGLERRATRGGHDVVDHAVGAHDDIANAAAGALVSLVTPVGANAWIEHAQAGGALFGLADRAERARRAAAEDDDEDRSARRERFHLPGRALPADEERDEAKSKQKQHPSQPAASVNNSVSNAYFSALSKAEGRVLSMRVPPCAWCGTETVGSRLTDGTRAWCNSGCQNRWITAKAEKARARAIAENGGLPLTR